MPITYERMTSKTDSDIPKLISIFKLPDVERYYAIDFENYFSYVTETPDVFFYKAYEGNTLIGAFHIEKSESTLYLSIVVFPEFQKMGKASAIVEDIKKNIFNSEYRKIEAVINDDNIASLKLFEKQGFLFDSKDGGLLTYIYKNDKLT